VSAVVEEQTRLSVPRHDVEKPELSIVVPALNEELTIAEFIRWCHEGLEEAGISGEILIADGSTDATAELALTAGARVLHIPERGIGRAYREAVPYARGRYVIVGDADCTYDFRCLKPFVDCFHEGYEFIMGSRWKGGIAPNAMPRLHQYFGTPITTWFLNLLYSTHFSDIHCGMRGLTHDSLTAMDLSSDSWDYSAEMIVKSVRMGLRTTEVPVPLLKDQEGRVSHHKRVGWFSPWHAAWLTLKAMFYYGSDFFLLRPGFGTFVLGLLITLPLSFGPITVGPIIFSLYWMLFGVTLTVIGLQSFLLGCIAQVMFDFDGRARRRWLAVFPYTRSAIVAATTALVGLACVIPLIVYYLSHHERLGSPASIHDHLAVTGLMLMMVGFSLFTFTLVLHGAAIATRRSPVILARVGSRRVPA
jgi:glycosyltransferase involved in cell wall biosynthesis